MKFKLPAFWAFFGLSAILLAVFYAPVLVFNREFFTSDHTFYFEPFARMIAAGYSQGHLPLWNPYCYCGMPQVANPSPGIFYFPNMLFVWVPYSKALGLILALHQLVAFAGAFLLVESLGWGVLPAAFCGLLMAFNGYMFSLSSNYTLPGCAAWGVLAIYGLVNVSRPRFARPVHKLGFVILTALSTHWMIMCGRPEVFVPFMALLGACAVFLNFGWVKPFIENEVEGSEATGGLDAAGKNKAVDWRPRMGTLTWQLGALVLGIMLSGPSLLPVYEWSKLSPRSSGLTMENVFKWSANWYDMMCMICAQPLGDLQVPSKYLTLVASHKHHYPFLPSALIGPVAFSLMFLGFFDKKYRARWHMLCGLTVATLLALGQYGPLSPYVLKLVPFLLVLRYPCKLLIVVILFAALPASRGVYMVALEKVKPWHKKFLVALWAVLLVVGCLLAGANQFCGAHLGKLPGPMVYQLGFSLIVCAAIGLITALIIAFGEKLKIKGPQAALLLVLIMTASIFAPAMKYAPRTTAAGYFAHPQTLSEMLDKYRGKAAGPQDGRLCVVYFDPLRVPADYEPRNSPQDKTQSGEPFMQFARELLLPNTYIDAKVRETFGYEASENKDFRDAFIKTIHRSTADKKGATDVELARFCMITGSKYFATQMENDHGNVGIFNPAYFKLLEEDDEMNLRLYEARSCLPRAYFASSFRTVANQDEAVEEIFERETKGAAGTSCEFDRNALIELDHKTDVTADPLNFTDRSNSRASAALNGQSPAIPTFSKTAVVSITEGQPAPAVSFLRDEPEHVSLSVNAPADGFLILNDRFYPGWHANVDTMPVLMYRANAFMRAVYVRKGSHLIEFAYEPESLRNGFYLAGVAGLVLAILLGIFLWQPGVDWINYLSTGKSAGQIRTVEAEKPALQEAQAGDGVEGRGS